MFDDVAECLVVQDGVLLSGPALAACLAGCAESVDDDRPPWDADAPPERVFPEIRESPADVVDRVIGLERLICCAQAEQAEALVEFAEHCPLTGPRDRGFAGRPDISEFAVDELSCALSLTRRAVDMRLSLALRLTECLPGTFAAWRNGDLDLRRVTVIADRTSVLTPEQATTVESRVLPKAAGKTTAQLRRLVDRAVISIDPGAANARHEQARHDRHVALRPSEDGMSTLRAELSAEDAVTVYATLSLIARMSPATDPRTMDQRRADTLIDLITGRTTPPTVPAGPPTGPPAGTPADQPAEPADNPTRTTDNPDTPHHPDTCSCTCSCGVQTSNYTGPHRTTPSADPGPTDTGAARRPGKPLIHVVVTAETLLGLDDAPADLAGHGPIPSDLARRIAADGTWHRILTDPLTGQVLDYGRTTYRPPAALADHIRARDRVCRFPPCQTPAHQSDLDHKKRYRHDGPTRPDNLWTLCRHHHHLKDTPTGWTTTGNPNGAITWTSPTGHQYVSHPHNYQDNDPPTWITPPPETATPQTTTPTTETDDEPPF